MYYVNDFAGLVDDTPNNSVKTLPGVSITLGAAGAGPSFAGDAIDHLGPAIRYVGGQLVTRMASSYPGNLFSTTVNLTASDGSRSGLGGGIAFSTDATRFELYTLSRGPSSSLYIYVDGKLASAKSPVFPNDGSLRYINFDLSRAGLSPGFHQIEVISYQGAFGDLIVPAGSTVRPIESVGPRIVFLGDSFTEGTGADSVQEGYVPIAGNLLGSGDIWKSGYGGTGYEISIGARPNLADRIVEDGVKAEGDIYVVAMGLNDVDTSPTLAQTTLKTIVALAEGAPNAKVFVVGYWNPGLPGSNLKPGVYTAVKEAVAQVPGVVFLDPVSVPFTTMDHTHPDSAGHLKLAEWLASQIRDSMGSDGLVDQGVVGDVVGPVFVDGWSPALNYSYVIFQNGKISSDFEIVENGTPFPLLKLRDGFSLNQPGEVDLQLQISDDSGAEITSDLHFQVRPSFTGSSGPDVLQATEQGGRIDGGSGNDFLSGSIGNDLILGGLGDDYLLGNGGVDKLIGGAGNDTYEVDGSSDIIVEDAEGGTDTIISNVQTYALPAWFETLRLGPDALTGGGNEQDNGLFGNAKANELYGWSGNDYLDGSLGADTMAGGSGNDSFVVDDPNDFVLEYAGQGYDIVYTILPTYHLSPFVEQLQYIGTGDFSGFSTTLDSILRGSIGNDILISDLGDDSLFGGAGNDTLISASGNDYLDGGTGADSLYGGNGNDFYIVDNNDDRIFESYNEGNDLVYTELTTYMLGDNIEQLQYSGFGDFFGTGNPLDNWIFAGLSDDSLLGLAGNDQLFGAAGNDALDGGEGDDYIDGGPGHDVLQGGAGNDYLDGGAGSDAMAGGLGNDGYVADDAGDLITEMADEGIDLVYTNLASFRLSDNVEQLQYTGEGDFVAFGNSLNNWLKSGCGNDSIWGGDGNDLLFGLSGQDELSGEAGRDYIDGGDGRDVLIGGRGSDALFGGSGPDTFLYSQQTDSTRTESDVIFDFASAVATGNGEYDTVDLTAVDANRATDGNQAFIWDGLESGDNSAHRYEVGHLGYSVAGGHTFIYGNTGTDALMSCDFTIILEGAIALSPSVDLLL